MDQPPRVLSLLLDPRGKGGTATLEGWYQAWMDRHRPGENRRVFLDDTAGFGDFARRGLRWQLQDERLPRLLPHLHVTQYPAARLLMKRYRSDFAEMHVIGAHVIHGSVAPWEVPSLAWFATTIADERRVVLAHHRVYRRWLYKASLPRLSRLERATLERCDRILVPSDHSFRVLREWGLPAGKIEVLAIPIDTNRYRPDGAERRGVLFVGRVHDPRKNFAAALALIDSSDRAAERGLDVVSPVDPRPRFQQAGRLPIRWWGRVERLEERYRAADVLVLTSLQEGFGLVVFEALACGTPVVAFRCGGPDKGLAESGGGFVVGDAAEMKEKVELLLTQPDLREEMGLRGREWVERNMSADSFMTASDLFRL